MRRKLKYFYDLNKEALDDINKFISDKIPSFMSDHNYDCLNRECENDGLVDLFYSTRYKYAWNREYYSIDYPFDIKVKISQYVREKYDFNCFIKEEQKLLSLYKKNQDQFWQKMDAYVDDDHVMTNILDRVKYDYYLNKRCEVFETLNDLYENKKYQAFISLGLIQIEGLFDDYCLIRYGEAENQGTLVEKVRKTLGTNEYNLMTMYPYFEFDIPLLRNEVAHKGILKTDKMKRTAYNLMLDLNTVSQMVKSASIDKFIYVKMTFDDLSKWTLNESNNTDSLFDSLFQELLMFDNMANDHFWKVVSRPENYKDEIDFYKKDDLPDDKIDLPGVLLIITTLVTNVGFWKAVHRVVDNNNSVVNKSKDIENFVRKIKNIFIGALDGDAKEECIKVAKLL